MLEAYVILVVFTIFGSLGGFFIKRATMSSTSFRALSTDYNLYVGFALYFVSAVLNIVVLTLLPYSVVLPCSAITYVWSIAFGRQFLKERVGILKVAGVALLIVGVVVLVMGAP